MLLLGTTDALCGLLGAHDNPSKCPESIHRQLYMESEGQTFHGIVAPWCLSDTPRVRRLPSMCLHSRKALWLGNGFVPRGRAALPE